MNCAMRSHVGTKCSLRLIRGHEAKVISSMNHVDEEFSQSLVFRRLIDQPDAVPIVAQWWFDEWGYLRPDDTLADWVRQIHSTMTCDGIPVHLIAIIGEEVVGTAVLKDHEMRSLYPDRRYWLGSMYVAEQHRGAGIATQLTMKTVEIASSMAIPALHLQTLYSNGGLYIRLG